MTKIRKIPYIIMLLVGLLSLILSVIVKDYNQAGWVFSATMWTLIAYSCDLRNTKLQKQIDDLNGDNSTKS